MAQCSTMMDCLAKFCELSGQKVNAHKSKFFMSPNMGADLGVEIEHFSGMKQCDDLGIYLGVPLLSKRVTKHTYSSLLEKV